MSTGTITPYRSAVPAGRDGFAQLLHAEWTKFRTVRGWVIGMIVAALLPAGLMLLVRSSCSTIGPNGQSQACSAPLGPDGQAVTDHFYFAHRPLAGNGSITVRVTSLTGSYSTSAVQPGQSASLHPGLQPWAKAGIMMKASTRPGSAYVAVLVTGSHGVRFQYDYTQDTPGLAGTVSAASLRWLRLVRRGDAFTGYDSADGRRWTLVGAATLSRAPATMQAGMLAAAPAYTKPVSQSVTGTSSTGGPAVATARIDRVGLAGTWPGGTWTGTDVGNAGDAGLGIGFRQAGGAYTMTGTGDIAPNVGDAAPDSSGTPIEQTLTGVFATLIAVIVIGAAFMTAEYRRGLIRTTLTASPRRGRVLAAKAVVIGAVAFAAGLAGAAIAVPLGEHVLRAGGNFVLPVTPLTELRVIAGTAALIAATAVLALAVGALLRRSAGAVTAVIVAIVLAYLLAVSVLPHGIANWVLRLTPAAAFAVQQTVVPYPQVIANYTPQAGYFPLEPWAGLAALCCYTALALALAMYVMRRRDA